MHYFPRRQQFQIRHKYFRIRSFEYDASGNPAHADVLLLPARKALLSLPAQTALQRAHARRLFDQAFEIGFQLLAAVEITKAG